MDLSKILAISGKPGLYEMISQTKNGFIVQSFHDNKRFPVFSHERVSSLEEISIFTDDDDLPLRDVLKLIHEHEEGTNALDHKSDPDNIKSYFAEVVPAYDRERVYVSDMKKVLSWYNLLLEKELLSFEEEESADDTKEKSGAEANEKPADDTGETQEQDTSKGKQEDIIDEKD